MNLSIFFFSANGSSSVSNKYRLLTESSRFADQNDFSGVWVPERHFDAFGGLYPNPSVLASALAMITSKLKIRAGSVVLPLQDTLRVAEEWSVVDNLSNGRVELAFASGWHVDDFVLSPHSYSNKKEITNQKIDEFLCLWSGNKITRINGEGKEIKVAAFPRPLQDSLQLWLTSQSEESFIKAGELGMNVLTNFTGKRIEDLASRIRLYKRARLKKGLNPETGNVALMMHTFVHEDEKYVKAKVTAGYGNYIRTNLQLQQRHFEGNLNYELSVANHEQLVSNAVERLFDTNGLVGTPHQCLQTAKKFQDIGVTEIACLIDFGISDDDVLSSLPFLSKLQRQLSNKRDFNVLTNRESEAI